MPRVSPHTLRSSMVIKQKAPESPIDQTEGAGQWEDVRCVICMEPPHNAILFHCSSSAKGCRPYMCDTSARHSNCFKQYRRTNWNRLSNKPLKCPLCRGEVNETMKVRAARKFMNAKPRSCSVDDCEFSGTYSQLQNHMKTKHPRFTQPKINPLKRRMWEQLERNDENIEIMNEASNWNSPEVLLHQLATNQVRSRVGVANYTPLFLPRPVIQGTNVFRGWPF